MCWSGFSLKETLSVACGESPPAGGVFREGEALVALFIKEGGSTLSYRPLDCTFAKTGGAVNGGRSPFNLPLTGSAGFAINY